MGERALWPGLGGTPLDLPLSDGLGGTEFSGGIARLYEKRCELPNKNCAPCRE
jgi:hypothetical protein